MRYKHKPQLELHVEAKRRKYLGDKFILNLNIITQNEAFAYLLPLPYVINYIQSLCLCVFLNLT